ncbi:hypothetical protein [Polyangium sp. y55x31]|uniref:hypothetical protein n=1 Tax=Polyangium sp. y55x31 TaxID=3042688 RepID=UPI002482F49D|nr:hypothetical protein [Polyangium sp. y55x31]MDI1480687.1 hypothetical protein [Polyangium sp. y55x31]
MKHDTMERLSRMGRGLLVASGLVLGSGCVADNAESEDTPPATGTPAARVAENAVSTPPNCRGAEGRAWRLTRSPIGYCSYAVPVYDPRTWISAGPLPSCASLWRKLRCVYGPRVRIGP